MSGPLHSAKEPTEIPALLLLPGQVSAVQKDPTDKPAQSPGCQVPRSIYP